VITTQQLDTLDPQQMRQALLTLMTEMTVKDEVLQRHQREVAFKQALIDKLTHELAILKRLKFAASSEKFGEKFCAGLSAEQQSLIEETLDTDIAQACGEIERVSRDGKDTKDKQKPKREALPAHLPRREFQHEPLSTACGCGCQMKRIGQDISEKLDYVPGVFTVERHVRGKWACAHCQKLVQAPVAAHIIDKGIPTAGLLAHVLVA
jgi:transposase